MSAPHNLLLASGSEMDVLHDWVGQYKIVASNRERVITRAARFEPHNNVVLGRGLGSDFEIQKVFGTQIQGINSPGKDRDAGMRRTVTNIIVTFRQANIELTIR